MFEEKHTLNQAILAWLPIVFKLCHSFYNALGTFGKKFGLYVCRRSQSVFNRFQLV